MVESTDGGMRATLIPYRFALALPILCWGNLIGVYIIVTLIREHRYSRVGISFIALLTAMFVWETVGWITSREIVEIAKDEILLHESQFGRAKTARFLTPHVSGLHYRAGKTVCGIPTEPSAIEFYHDGENHAIGVGLGESDAARLMNTIREYLLPQRQTSSGTTL